MQINKTIILIQEIIIKSIKYIILVHLFLSGFNLHSQNSFLEGQPFVCNYQSAEYKAHSQNWNAIQGDNGIMYFANNECILEYDGAYWRSTKIPGQTTVRSLAIDSTGVIYVGSYQEFGSLSADKTGKLQYKALSAEIVNKDFYDIWKIFSTSNGIYFLAFNNLIYRWHNGELTEIKISPALIFFYAFQVNDDVYIAQDSVGLCKLNGNKINMLDSNDFFKEKESTRYFLLERISY